eukprot:2526079-Pleurochrysis_carterae.AAC.2
MRIVQLPKRNLSFGGADLTNAESWDIARRRASHSGRNKILATSTTTYEQYSYRRLTLAPPCSSSYIVVEFCGSLTHSSRRSMLD